MKKWLIAGWLAVGILVLLGAFFLAQQNLMICWDGYEVDEELLMDMCGITEEAFLSGDYDNEACPNADEAMRMVGGCEPDLPAVMVATGMVGLGYLLLSVVLLVLWRLVRHFF